MWKHKMAAKVVSLVLALTFISGQVFAGGSQSDCLKTTLAPSAATDKDINPPRSKSVGDDMARMWAERFLSKVGVSFAHDKILKERMALSFTNGNAMTLLGPEPEDSANLKMPADRRATLTKARDFVRTALLPLDDNAFIMDIARKIANTAPSKEGAEFHKLVVAAYEQAKKDKTAIENLKTILLYQTRFVGLALDDQLLNPYLYSIGDIASEEHRVIVAHAGRFAYEGSENIPGGPRSIYLTFGRIFGYEALGEKGIEAFKALITHELTDLAAGHKDEDIPVLTEANRIIDEKYKTEVIKATQTDKHGAIRIDTNKVAIEKYQMISELGTKEVFAIFGSSKVHKDVPKGSRKINLMFAKADVGSKGGHGTVVPAMIEAVADVWAKAAEEGKILDFFITRVGDDISVTVTHINGKDNEMMHKLVWDGFLNGTTVSKDMSLYGAGQDLLADSFSGNVKGAGPGVTELEFVERGSEPIIVLQADKCGPGVFNEAIRWVYTDTNSAFVSLKPEQANKVKFGIVDFEHNNKVGREAVLDPQKMNGLMFGQAINLIAGEQTRYSFTTLTMNNEDIAGVTAQRLHNIAGEYTGKDDPGMVVRTQKDLPAEGLFTAPFFRLYKVVGWMMGSSVGYFLPASLQEAKIGVNDGPPLIAAFGFNINNGRLVGFMDMFAANPAIKAIQQKVGEATVELLSSTDFWTQGKGRAPDAELAYQKGIGKTLSTIPWQEQSKPHDKPAAKETSAKHETPKKESALDNVGVNPRVYLELPVTGEELSLIAKEAGQTKPINVDDKTGFIFGEKAAFGRAVDTPTGIEYEPGLGILLPKFAKSGIRVAVITTTERQRALIEEMNAGNSPDEQILCVGSIQEAKSAMSLARYNYFKVSGDIEVADDRSITVFDVTLIAKRIIEILGTYFGMAADEISRMQAASIRFAQAA